MQVCVDGVVTGNRAGEKLLKEGWCSHGDLAVAKSAVAICLALLCSSSSNSVFIQQLYSDSVVRGGCCVEICKSCCGGSLQGCGDGGVMSTESGEELGCRCIGGLGNSSGLWGEGSDESAISDEFGRGVRVRVLL